MFQYIAVLRSRFIHNIPIGSRVSATAALGRWSIEASSTSTYRKVDLANEDHCGTCASEQAPVRNFVIVNDDIIYLE
jgi:hypothetical protein